MVKSLILTTATRYLLPLLLLFSVFILLRGHNEPGGGFIGGLIAAAAFILYGVSTRMAAVRQTLVIQPLQLMGIGLLTAVTAGLLPPFLTGQPFMTGIWTTREFPAIGKLGTPLLFDIGVYLTVIGVTLLIIMTLAEDD
ncbi:MAG: Na+/H+ antiporter subunit B [Anaerolineaceae bacterium]|nr:Na+/H+ antiporter subunit B [Anaerolineaceae bacterium]